MADWKRWFSDLKLTGFDICGFLKDRMHNMLVPHSLFHNRKASAAPSITLRLNSAKNYTTVIDSHNGPNMNLSNLLWYFQETTEDSILWNQ